MNNIYTKLNKFIANMSKLIFYFTENALNATFLIIAKTVNEVGHSITTPIIIQGSFFYSV